MTGCDGRRSNVAGPGPGREGARRSRKLTTKTKRAEQDLKQAGSTCRNVHVGDRSKSPRSLTRFPNSRRRQRPDKDQGFTLIEVVIAISLLVIMMIPFADAYITSFSATSDAHIREVAAMVGDSALDQARALDATDQQNGCVLLAGRGATAVQTEWQNPAPGTSQLLSETAEVSDTSQTCTASATTPLPTTAQVETVGGHTFDVYYYVGTCWETENTTSGSGSNTCTNPASPPSTDYEMYRVIVAVTWSAPRGGCSSTGCDYVTATLISTTSNPTFDVNPTIPYINSADNATFTIDSPGSFQVTTTGFPPPIYTDVAYGNTACTPSALPTGISLSTAGLLSGTPPPGSAGDYKVCITATNRGRYREPGVCSYRRVDPDFDGGHGERFDVGLRHLWHRGDVV